MFVLEDAGISDHRADLTTEGYIKRCVISGSIRPECPYVYDLFFLKPVYMPEWVCVDCNARYDERTSPCRQCASEQIARLDETDAGPDRIEERDEIVYICRECNTEHLRNNPPCNNCGHMMLEAMKVKHDGERSVEGPTMLPDSEFDQGVLASAGDVLFNKSTTRQLIDVELLFVTGFTWITFLLSELLYHHWRLSNGKTTQYSYAGGTGEGWITKFAKVLFYLQVIGVVFLLALLMAA